VRGPAGIFHRAVTAAASLTGKRFGLLVASSLVATSAIVASALSNPAGNGPLAALLGRTLAADSNPAVSSPAPESSGGGSAAPSPGEHATPSAPVASPPPPEPLSSSPEPEPAPEESAPKPPPAAPTPEAGRIKHVFVISLTSPGYEAAFGAGSQMPYLSGTLRPQGVLLSNYTLLEDAGIANSIAAVSGQPPNAQTKAGCPTYAEFPPGAKANGKGVVHGAGCVYPVETLTLADQLTSARFTWRAYMEGMVDETGKPNTCVHPGSGEAETAVPGGYAMSQNPFAYFHSLLDLGGCAINDVPIDQLSADLHKVNKTPNYSFIAPTPCDSGATGQCSPGAPKGPANADAFLAQWVPKIQASPAFKKDGLLVVTFDAAAAAPAEAGTTTAAAGDPLRVGALLVSPFATKGGTEAAPFNPYSLFRSSEELFGLQQLAMGADPKTKTFAPGLLGETGGD
jgi:Phosphoesterase family